MEDIKTLKFVTIGVSLLAVLFVAIGTFSPAWLLLNFSTRLRGLMVTASVEMGLFSVVVCVDPGLGNSCRSASMEEVYRAMTISGKMQDVANMKLLMGNFAPLRGLMITGLLASVLGTTCLILYHRNVAAYGKSQKKQGILCTLAFGLAALMVFSAVAAEGQQNTNIRNTIPYIQMYLKAESQTVSGYDPHSSDSVLSRSDNIPLSSLGDMVGTDGTTTSPRDVYDAINSLEIKLSCPWAMVMSGLGASLLLLTLVGVALWLCKRHDDGSEWHEFSNEPKPQ